MELSRGNLLALAKLASTTEGNRIELAGLIESEHLVVHYKKASGGDGAKKTYRTALRLRDSRFYSLGGSHGGE
jgi:hypothetical protein